MFPRGDEKLDQCLLMTASIIQRKNMDHEVCHRAWPWVIDIQAATTTVLAYYISQGVLKRDVRRFASKLAISSNYT